MNQYIKLILFMILGMPLFVAAQSYTQTIRGKILDGDSHSPLPGAAVMIIGSDPLIGSLSDTKGDFRLEKIPVGRVNIKVALLGYDDVVLQNIVVGSGKEVVLQIEMHEKVYNANVVEIVFERDKTKANNELITNSARNFNSEETERYAGSRGDPSKMVANYAGVATGNDARNDIIVRGNSPLGVLWRLEGVDIPNPNHFSAQGATGGPVSILNNNVLGNSDFLTGAFPAEYGNKMAAVFDLKIRNGNNERREYTGQIGFNGLELGTEGPIKKANGSSYLASYRYSTLELFDLLGISFGVSATPKYQDATFKVNLPMTDKSTLSVWGIGGLSNIELLDSKKKESDWSFTSSGEDLIFTSSMMATGASHLYFFNSNTSGKLNLSFSAARFLITIDTLGVADEKFRTFENNSTDGQGIINYTLSKKINARHTVKTGLIYSHLFFNYNALYYSRINNSYRSSLDEKNNSGIVQSFVHWQYRLTDKLTMNSGLHFQQFLLNNSKAFEPRAGLRWQFHEKQSVNIAYGMHAQMQPLIYYFFKSYNSTGESVQSNHHLDFTKAHHLIAGYDFNFAKDYRLKLEAYYQSLYNAPVEEYYKSSFSMINVGNDLEGIPLIDSLTNTGTGKNYGIELTLEKFFSKHFYMLNSLSIYEARYKGSDGIERFSSFSGSYVYNGLLGYEIPLGNDNMILAFDGKITMAGGNRYTPIDIEESIKQRTTVYKWDEAYTRKFKDYRKVDFKVSVRLNKKKVTQVFFVNIENIFNRKNILRENYDENTGKLVTEYQLGLFPYGGYRIEF